MPFLADRTATCSIVCSYWGTSLSPLWTLLLWDVLFSRNTQWKTEWLTFPHLE